jgi:hypothetical protein
MDYGQKSLITLAPDIKNSDLADLFGEEGKIVRLNWKLFFCYNFLTFVLKNNEIT